MFAFCFFFIAFGYNPFFRKKFSRDWELNPTEPDNMAKEDTPPIDPRGFFSWVWDRLFGDQGDEAALKEKEAMWDRTFTDFTKYVSKMRFPPRR